MHTDSFFHFILFFYSQEILQSTLQSADYPNVGNKEAISAAIKGGPMFARMFGYLPVIIAAFISINMCVGPSFCASARHVALKRW